MEFVCSRLIEISVADSLRITDRTPRCDLINTTSSSKSSNALSQASAVQLCPGDRPLATGRGFSPCAKITASQNSQYEPRFFVSIVRKNAASVPPPCHAQLVVHLPEFRLPPEQGSSSPSSSILVDIQLHLENIEHPALVKEFIIESDMIPSIPMHRDAQFFRAPDGPAEPTHCRVADHRRVTRTPKIRRIS